MGLDAVELILRTEDEFGITIADDEAETASTVGRLYEIILSKLDLTPRVPHQQSFLPHPSRPRPNPRSSPPLHSPRHSSFPATHRRNLPGTMEPHLRLHRLVHSAAAHPSLDETTPLHVRLFRLQRYRRRYLHHGFVGRIVGSPRLPAQCRFLDRALHRQHDSRSSSVCSQASH